MEEGEKVVKRIRKRMWLGRRDRLLEELGGVRSRTGRQRVPSPHLLVQRGRPRGRKQTG